MSPSSRLIAILFAMAPMTAMAQQQPDHADPANAAASGQPIAYVSVFTGFQATPAAGPSPDKSWIAHNRQLMPAAKAAAPGPIPASTPATTPAATPSPPPAHQHGSRGQGS